MYPARKKELLANLGLSLFSIVFVLVVLDIVFRAAAYREDRKLLQNAPITTGIINDGSLVNVRHIIRLEDNDRLIYSLKPNLNVELLVTNTSKLHTNSAGFRGPEYPQEKAVGVVRIVGVGDSFMFGLGVDDGFEYMRKLEQTMNMRHPEKRWEAVNLSVPGYNTVMEVEMLREKGLEYAPDIVIVGFYSNDLELPHFIRNEEDYFTLRKSFLLNYFLKRMGKAQDHMRVPAEIVNPGYAEGAVFRGREIPAKYVSMVGERPFIRAMKELRALSIEHGFRVVLFMMTENWTEDDALALKTGQELGFTVINAFPVFQDYVKSNGFERLMGSPFTINAEDPHPSPIGHRIAADILYRGLMSSMAIAPPA